jgi:hypothetical protein
MPEECEEMVFSLVVWQLMEPEESVEMVFLSEVS